MKRELGVGLAVVVAGALIAGIVFYIDSPPSPPAPVPEAAKSDLTELEPILPSDDTDYSQYYVNTIKDAGVTWLNTPRPLGDLKLVTGQHAYYQIGSDNGKDIIVTFIPCDGPCFSDDHLLFLEIGENYSYLLQHSSFDPSDQGGSYELAAGVVQDKDKFYKSLNAPAVLTAGVDKFRIGSSVSFFNRENLTFFAQTEYGPLYRLVVTLKEQGIRNEHIYDIQSNVLRLPGGLAQEYLPTYDFVADDSIPRITWSDGSRNTDSYRFDGVGGCGSFGAVAIAAEGIVKDTDLEIAGTTDTGHTVYEFRNPYHLIPSYYYGITNGNYYENSQVKSITIEEFKKLHGLFIYKDSAGGNIIFSNLKYGPQAECAKPVIYLYPTQETNVSVKVGASVRKSDPVYENGWMVTAKPDGTLTVAGKRYDSLFWDGVGQGSYPAITQGFVVKRDRLENTLEDHLTHLSLTEKERRDFTNFWMPYMPSTPYVRLTWLGTAEMNKLAPLEVTPKPDSVIRVFLDFEGLSSYKEIPPQELKSISRHGFTLVEWGGLLVK